MTKTWLAKILKQHGLDVEALEWPGTGTKTLRYYHVDKKGKRLSKTVSRAELKAVLDAIIFHIHN